MNFPENPEHGTIFELRDGLLFEYNASTNAWISIVSSDRILPLATTVKPGAMDKADLAKLNRLLIPPPRSTIIGTDCVSSFRGGSISLKSGDDFVNVEGNVSIQNIDEFGDRISQLVPFKIHQHTYGFDFNLNLPALEIELKTRGQFDPKGITGDKGNTGDRGDVGISEILSGPQGAKGIQGQAPECLLSIEPEPVLAQARPGLKKALSTVRINIDPLDQTKYSLEFDRQNVGVSQISVDKFNVRQQQSSWVLAVTSVAGDPQQVYYIDVEPIIDAIHEKFLEEVDRLKTGYEDIVKFWVQTMSDLFDEQKTALCCALEFCKSKTKNVEVRQHMENVAAATVGRAKAILHHRGDASEISGTRLRERLPDQGDSCKESDPKPFPEPPDRVAVVSSQTQTLLPNRTVLSGTWGVGVDSGTPGNRQWHLAVDEGIDNADNIAARDGGTGSTGVIGFPVPGSNAVTNIQARIRAKPVIPGANNFAVSLYNGNILLGFAPTLALSGTAYQIVSAVFSNVEYPLGAVDDLRLSFVAPNIDIDAVELVVTSTSTIQSQSAVQSQTIIKQSVENTIEVDPLLNVGASNAVVLELDKGSYTAIISKMASQIDNEHYFPVMIRYSSNGVRYTKFLDKGRFKSLLDGKNTYEGLTTKFQHDGGQIKVYYNMLPSQHVSGSGVIKFKSATTAPSEAEVDKAQIVKPPSIKHDNITCRMSYNKILWYKSSWDSGNCCGCIINISGQDYIILKRSLGEDLGCGGSEVRETPCIAKFIDTIGHPAIAWPTLDGTTFAPIPQDGSIFKYNADISAIVEEILNRGEFSDPVGNPNGLRHLAFRLNPVIFPT